MQHACTRTRACMQASARRQWHSSRRRVLVVSFISAAGSQFSIAEHAPFSELRHRQARLKVIQDCHCHLCAGTGVRRSYLRLSCLTSRRPYFAPAPTPRNGVPAHCSRARALVVAGDALPRVRVDSFEALEALRQLEALMGVLGHRRRQVDLAKVVEAWPVPAALV